MGINGGGYIFIRPSMVSKLLPQDIFYLLNKTNLADDVLLRISRLDGSQPYTVIKQFTNTGGIAVLLNDFQGYTIPVNAFLGDYIFLGITSAANATHYNVQGLKSNNQDVIFKNTNRNRNAYFAFFPNNREVKPSRYLENSLYERQGVSVDWRQTAVRPFSGRRIPLEYFMFTEMHFGGGGTYSSSDRWLNATIPALGTAIRLRKHQNVIKKSQKNVFTVFCQKQENKDKENFVIRIVLYSFFENKVISICSNS